MFSNGHACHEDTGRPLKVIDSSESISRRNRGFKTNNNSTAVRDKKMINDVSIMSSQYSDQSKEGARVETQRKRSSFQRDNDPSSYQLETQSSRANHQSPSAWYNNLDHNTTSTTTSNSPYSSHSSDSDNTKTVNCLADKTQRDDFDRMSRDITHENWLER